MSIKIENLVREYKIGDSVIRANDNISFEIPDNKFVVILGPSGAGKSTLLNLIGGMDRPTSGSIKINDLDISKLNEEDRTKYRRYKVGFVFQHYNLIPNLTVFENVELTKEISNSNVDCIEILNLVNLSHRLDSFPSNLSGGEMQRVAIARAIVKNPDFLLCDEPTGALDIKNSKLILKLLKNISKNFGKTVILITHNNAIAEMADIVITISDSKVKNIKYIDNPKNIENINW